MKNLFNQPDAAAIVNRMKRLPPGAQRQWGKMNAAQMLAHCNASLETAMGTNELKPAPLPLRWLGKLLKKGFLSEKPLPKNTGTAKEYQMTGDYDFEAEKAKAVRQIESFCKGGVAACPTRNHPFFGNMQSKEWAVLQWKHFDHHLRQFGA